MITHELHKTNVKIIRFFRNINIIDNEIEIAIKHLITHLFIFHKMIKIFITKIINNFIKTKDSTLTSTPTDILEPYTQEQHMRQPRPNLASQNNNFYSQNLVNTDSYEPTQMQNENPLPYYLQQHEITES